MRTGIAASSLVFAFHRLLPEHEAARRGPLRQAQEAETRCSGAFPSARSWLPREVFPSMATRSGRSGQVSRTHPENAAENSAGIDPVHEQGEPAPARHAVIIG